MRVPRVTLDMLVALVAVTEKKRLDSAAAVLGLGTASAVQKRIKAINALFGVELFTNIGNKMLLTEEGQVLYVDAVRAIEQALLAEERIVALTNLKAGRLLIGHSTNLPPKLLAKVLRMSMNDPLPIQIEHFPGYTELLAQRVSEGTLHAAFGALPIPRPDLISRVLLEEPVVAAIPVRHRLAIKPYLRPQDFDGEPVIAVARHTLPWLHEEIREFFSGFGIDLKQGADAFGPPEAMVMVENGIGICLVGASAVARPGVVAKPLEPKVLTRKSGLFVREDNRHPVVKLFIEQVLETMQSNPFRR